LIGAEANREFFGEIKNMRERDPYGSLILLDPRHPKADIRNGYVWRSNSGSFGDIGCDLSRLIARQVRTLHRRRAALA
jgi:hypothetical protein